MARGACVVSWCVPYLHTATASAVGQGGRKEPSASRTPRRERALGADRAQRGRIVGPLEPIVRRFYCEKSRELCSRCSAASVVHSRAVISSSGGGSFLLRASRRIVSRFFPLFFWNKRIDWNLNRSEYRDTRGFLNFQKFFRVRRSFYSLFAHRSKILEIS